MDDSRLTAIRERHGRATKGPWQVRADNICEGPDNGFVPFMGCGCCGSPWMEPSDDDATAKANAAFIAASWQDVSDLLAEVERLRGELRCRDTMRTQLAP